MEDFLQQLNDSQREAVLYNEGPSLVIAGAGSGKTRVLTYKIAWLLQNGVSPYHILALTFTNKAAREMKSRIAQIVGDDTARRLWMGTFHSIFSRILRRESDKIGFRSDFTVYDAQDSKNLIKSIIKEKSLDDKIYKPNQIQARISKVKNALITPERYASDRDLIEYDNFVNKPHIQAIYATYWNRCRTAQAMDFDDLLLYTSQLFTNSQETVERYRNQFRFILVDEYQDTNAVQHEIIQQLANEQHCLCMVGDDAQSIYSFRGANIGNILNFRKTYPESRLFKLEQNYRSTQTIVNAANSLIDKNKEQIPKTVYSKKQVGEKILVIGAYSDFEEGYTVAGRIAEMRMVHHYEYKDFAILYRTNAQSRIFEESLRKINIPYKIYGGLSFYQRKEIKDIIAYMRMVANPSDEEAFKRIINYPARGIGDTTVNKIVSAAALQNVSLWSVISNPLEYNLNINAGTAKKLEGFRMLIQQLIEAAAEQNAYEVGNKIIRETGLISGLYEDRTTEGLSRVQNVEELATSLHDFTVSRMEEGIEEVKIGDYLSEISLLTDQDTDKDENANRVTMMTIHSAKGLEFKNVFVVGLEENLFPSERSRDNAKEIEEERRLFYVGITRAEENAVLTYAKSRFRNGQTQSCTPSRFLRDIDPEYLRLSGSSALERSWSPRSSSASIPRIEPGVHAVSRKFSPVESVQSTPVATHQSIGNLHIGDVIRHERFGQGKVTALTGENENAKATVDFDNFGNKQLLLKFARFEVVTSTV
ncbi:MAG: UvrD-helicase domain-containing protein [Candidatus Symbiothrix sp.]|jgi:DNA helicase-2/ATP-dependent DNA helicase PcrA|nr:UvrD-helicase domain-containing protein [Candidatus Symbiothrix sp.]